MTDRVHGAAGQVLRGIRHGGEVLPDDAPHAKDRAAAEPGTELASAVLTGGTPLTMAEVPDATTGFDYLFRTLMHDAEAHLPGDPATVRLALRTLGAAMVEPAPAPPADSTIPPVYTYLGQFVDHDLTANTDRKNVLGHVSDADLAPVDPDTVAAELRNLRLPALNLDSVYGDGPGPGSASADQYDGILLRVGTVATEADPGRPAIGGVRIPLEADLARDLPRDAGGGALLGDGRNDENLVVAQLHTAFLRAHNAAVRWVRTHEHPKHHGEDAVFRRAQQLVRWHYQWIVLHDFLPTVTLPGVVDEVLLDGEHRLYEPRNGTAWMPLEFSVATFRFGHTMVRGAYDYNRNFGRGAHVIPTAPFGLLFLFTGRGGFAGATRVLPFNWVIEWDRFTSAEPRFPDRFARKIDTMLAPPLLDLANEVTGLPTGTPDEVRVRDILRMLAVRNLLRGYQLSLPTGQAVATLLGLTPLSGEELRQGNSDAVNSALAAGGFTERTPLWYYVLKEAEVRADGNSLGEVGSRIVAETIVGQVRHDPEAYLAHGWTPSYGLRTADDQPVRSIRDLLRFAGVLPTRE